jgi:hypothetical protein
MKNLLERMKAEPLAKLNEQKKLYPTTFTHLENDLKNNQFVIDLKYETVLKLNNYDIASTTKFTSITELFNY